MDVEDLVRGYALKNAVKHDGRAVVGSVISMIMSDHPELRPKARVIAAIARRVVEEVNKLTLAEQKNLLKEKYPWALIEKPKEEEKERALSPLPGAEEGKVVTRFAPNPDFVIHLGNARPAILSDEYAKMYKGKMILRFEDTDPRTKKPLKEAYDLIKKDLKWLGVSWHEEYVQSMRLDFFYKIAREAIAKGCAYVDTCREKSRELLSMGKYCPTRDNPPEWHLDEFDKMINGYYNEGEAVLRFKTDPKHPNPSVRDWVAFRIIDTIKYPHPLVGSKYVVWPTYNFAVSVDDHTMGVTHVLRGKEHQVNTEKQLYVYNCMGWRPPVFIHFGRLKLEGFIMSKSFIRKLIEENPEKFMGFNDPRFGTIAGLRRRGILPEAIRSLILEVGIKRGDARISWDNLAATNRKLLDPIADRIMYVWDPQPMRVILDSCISARIPYHPDKPNKFKTINVCPNDVILLNKEDVKDKKVRLLGLGNFRIEAKELILESTSLEEARALKLPIIQWVLEKEKVRLTVLKPKGLDLIKNEGYAEKALSEYQVDDRLQLIRYGFIRIDSINNNEYIAVFSHK